MVGDDEAATWLFVFKLNAGIFPSDKTVARPCPFGGTANTDYDAFSLSYAWASDAHPVLASGSGAAGEGNDPLGATFSQIYRAGYHYVVWNDQFYQHPQVPGCSGDSCSSPWGHAKGVVAWNDAGEGLILQVTTPSRPAAASPLPPRSGDGNTLGCVGDNDVKVSQDFFSLRLSEPDLEKILDALANASVATDTANPQLVDSGGPDAVRQRVALLGHKSTSTSVLKFTLSSGVRLISKPSKLNVPPWQLVSAELGGIDLRAATWWTSPAIPSTTATSPVACWNSGLIKPGAVQIATSGRWDGRRIALRGGPGNNANHAKVGISLSGAAPLTIFGDMNQQGGLGGKCDSSQNGRGGLFFVVEDQALHDSVQGLIAGDTAPLTIAVKGRVAPVSKAHRALRKPARHRPARIAPRRHRVKPVSHA
jgi:Deoxyribonuclease II